MSSTVVASVVAGLLGFVMGIFIGVYSAMEEVTDLRIRLQQEKALSKAVIKQLKQKLEEYKNGGDKGDSIYGDEYGSSRDDDISDSERPGSNDIWE